MSRPVYINLSFFGATLDLLRAQHGQTLYDVAAQVGCSLTTLVNARKFPLQREPQQRMLRRLADYVGSTPDEVRAAMRIPADNETERYPISTCSGIQYAPAVLLWNTSCARCDLLELCKALVYYKNGLAMCEALIEADVLPPDVAAIVARNDMEAMTL